MQLPINVVSTHIFGLLDALGNLQASPSTLDDWEWLWMEHWWVLSLQQLWFPLMRTPLSPNAEQSAAMDFDHTFSKLHELHSKSIVPVDLRVKLGYLEQLHWLKLRRLQMSVRYHLTEYLLQLTDLVKPEASRDLVSALQQVLSGICKTIREYNIRLSYDAEELSRVDLREFNKPISIPDIVSEDIEEVHLEYLSLYLNCMIIHHTLVPVKFGQSDSIAIGSAVSLCRVCASRQLTQQFEIRSNIRDMFLAGLVLRYAGLPPGN
jgi:hypothetical protein